MGVGNGNLPFDHRGSFAPIGKHVLAVRVFGFQIGIAPCPVIHFSCNTRNGRALKKHQLSVHKVVVLTLDIFGFQVIGTNRQNFVGCIQKGFLISLVDKHHRFIVNHTSLPKRAHVGIQIKLIILSDLNRTVIYGTHSCFLLCVLFCCFLCRSAGCLFCRRRFGLFRRTGLRRIAPVVGMHSCLTVCLTGSGRFLISLAVLATDQQRQKQTHRHNNCSFFHIDFLLPYPVMTQPLHYIQHFPICQPHCNNLFLF